MLGATFGQKGRAAGIIITIETQERKKEKKRKNPVGGHTRCHGLLLRRNKQKQKKILTWIYCANSQSRLIKICKTAHSLTGLMQGTSQGRDSYFPGLEKTKINEINNNNNRMKDCVRAVGIGAIRWEEKERNKSQNTCVYPLDIRKWHMRKHKSLFVFWVFFSPAFFL